MLKHLLLIVLIVSYSALNGQNATDTSLDINKRFSIKQLKDDLTVLKDSLEILHPALYRYTSSKILEMTVEIIKDFLNKQ